MVHAVLFSTDEYLLARPRFLGHQHSWVFQVVEQRSQSHSILLTVTRGVLLYSIKALTRAESLRNIYTNANGPSVYERCQTKCFNASDEQSLTAWIKERVKAEFDDEGKPIKDDVPVDVLYSEVCHEFWEDFENPDKKEILRSKFHKGWIEPQSIIRIEHVRGSNCISLPV